MEPLGTSRNAADVLQEAFPPRNDYDASVGPRFVGNSRCGDGTRVGGKHDVN